MLLHWFIRIKKMKGVLCVCVWALYAIYTDCRKKREWDCFSRGHGRPTWRLLVKMMMMGQPDVKMNMMAWLLFLSLENCSTRDLLKNNPIRVSFYSQYTCDSEFLIALNSLLFFIPLLYFFITCSWLCLCSIKNTICESVKYLFYLF